MWLIERYYVLDGWKAPSPTDCFFTAERWVDGDGGLMLLFDLDRD